MKLRLLYLAFIICTTLSFTLQLYAQNTPLSINVNNQPIHKILDLIEEQSVYSFLYDANIVNVNQRISVNVQNENIFDLLKKIFRNVEIGYTVINNQIILNNKKKDSSSNQLLTKVITGIVTDEYGIPISGATILVEGTKIGTISNIQGQFRFRIPLKSIIQVSYIGYCPQKIEYKGNSLLEIALTEDIQSLEEVVVTALGIKRHEFSLTYATQTINSDELTKIQDLNFINTLAGKVAGLKIDKSSSGSGGSAKVSIRGNRSISGNNQPLYVIDGFPILNSSNEQTIGEISNTTNRDGGDGISNLNQSDIESINILKGASASALYGSQAANGVILITTKKGKPDLNKITFSSSLTTEQAINIPKFQNQYGKTEGSNSSWGEMIKDPVSDHVKDFFQTGSNQINSLSLTTGSETSQTYFSYANTQAKGLIENNSFKKHNINIRETTSLLGSRLTLDGSVHIITQKVNNKPIPGGIYMNPIQNIYTFPRGLNMSPYKTTYEKHNEERNLPEQNWYTNITDIDQNPYWLINRTQSTDKRSRLISFIAASLKVTDWFSLQGRGSMDYVNDKYNQKIYATTSPGIAGLNGRYIDYLYEETLLYGDLMATFSKAWDHFSYNLVIGSSISDNKINLLRLDSRTASLYYPNIFTVSNINMSANAHIDERQDAHKQLQSLFSTMQLSYMKGLFIDITARNDWSSTLAYTKSNRKGFFYPSVGFAWIMNRMIHMSDWISFAKVRASWSSVGNDLPLFASNTISHIQAGGIIKPNNITPFDNLKPEKSNSCEIGTEWHFFDHRLLIDFSLYQTNTKNQLFTLPTSAGADYKYYFVNAGDIQNQGIELILETSPLQSKNFIWKNTINFSRNKNLVKKLHKDLPVFIYGDENSSSSYSMRLKEGGSFGDIYGKVFKRDAHGKIEYDSYGIPLSIGDGNTEKVGNSNPDFMLGFGNTITFKDISLYLLIDGHFGGDVLSQTQAVLDKYGVSQRTGDARTAGFVNLEGNHISNVRSFYEQIGGRNGVTEFYMYDATNIRLKELSLSYSFPQKWIKQTNILKELQLSLVSRNLFFINKKAPFDPDVVASTDNYNQGVDLFGMPSTRSLGVNLKVTL